MSKAYLSFSFPFLWQFYCNVQLILLLHAPSSFTIQAQTFCELGWTYFSGTNSCYKVGSFTSYGDQPAAQFACLGLGSNLTSIHSPAENSFLLQLTTNNQNYNTGSFPSGTTVFPHMGAVLDVGCTYKWLDGTPFDYSNWASGEPSCGGEACTVFYSDNRDSWTSPPANGFWNDGLCSTLSTTYICKKPAFMTLPPTSTPIYPSVCETGWQYFDGTQSCYKFDYSIGTFSDANLACISQAANLTSIHSAAENSFLLSLTTTGQNYINVFPFPYLGGVLVTSSPCTYKWVDGTPFDYNNFYPGEPSCNGEDCMFFYSDNRDSYTSPPANGYWNDEHCTRKTDSYICKKAAVFSSTTVAVTTTYYCDPGWTYFAGTHNCYKVGFNSNWNDANVECILQNSNLASVHSAAENSFLVELSTTNQVYSGPNIEFPYLGGIVNDPIACTYKWSDGTTFDFDNFYPNEPNCVTEGCIQLMSDYKTAITSPAAKGYWNDIDCQNIQRAYICKKVARIWPVEIEQELAVAVQEQNFNREYLPFVLANTPIAAKENMSWRVEDLYIWSSYERTELNISKDLTKWYENSMGNCFTFNHENASKISNLRYSGEFGGFKAKMKVIQEEYFDWVYTASLLLFLHHKEETIMGESMSYQIAPGEEASFVVQRKKFTRKGPPYGKCIKDKSEIKSYYNPGSAYIVDSCFRSCYQDYVKSKCGCMDPRYFMPSDAKGCDMLKRKCVDNIVMERGEPSTWPECSCPPPCIEYIFDVMWTKTLFKKPNCYANASSTDCLTNSRRQSSVFSVTFPKLVHQIFTENLKTDLNDVVVSLCNLTGLLLGLSAISLFEILFLLVRTCYVFCMNKNAIHLTKEEDSPNVFDTLKFTE